jgi:RHS repeat-associated protein
VWLAKRQPFTYDNLNRLNTAQVNGLQSDATNFAPNGNITNKTDAGTYQYDPLKIHALAQLNVSNNVSRWNQDVVYTQFQRPEKITENSTELIYTYGADYERRKAVLNTNWATVYTRYYLGDYELTTRNGVNQYVHYITGGDGVCAIAVKDGNSAFNFYVPYTDHLGSILTITNTSGAVIAEQNFDAWGRKRNTTTWDYANVAANPTWLYRGYTGHEHLPEFNLINMNARLYDPVLGRMLSPDNMVSMGGSQGLNRYTYAYNNPTKYADLDGNCPMCIGAAIGAIVDIGIQMYYTNQINWAQVGLAAISGAVGGGVGAWVGGSAALATSSAVVQGAISGAAAGAASGLVSGFMNGQRGWDLAKTVGISAGVGAAVGAGAGYLKGRFFPPKTKGGIPSEPEPGKGGRYNGASELIHLNRVETSTGVTGTLEGAEIGEVTVISKTIEVPTGPKLALGLDYNLFKFAKAINAQSYRQFGGFTLEGIQSAMANPDNTLHFNLTGFDEIRYELFEKLYDPTILPSQGNITNWELYNIYNTSGMLQRTTFYRLINGSYQIVPKPF